MKYHSEFINVFQYTARGSFGIFNYFNKNILNKNFEMLVMLPIRTIYFIFKYSNILYIYIILLCAFYISCYISFDKWEILLHKPFIS